MLKQRLSERITFIDHRKRVINKIRIKNNDEVTEANIFLISELTRDLDKSNIVYDVDESFYISNRKISELLKILAVKDLYILVKISNLALLYLKTSNVLDKILILSPNNKRQPKTYDVELLDNEKNTFNLDELLQRTLNQYKIDATSDFKLGISGISGNLFRFNTLTGKSTLAQVLKNIELYRYFSSYDLFGVKDILGIIIDVDGAFYCFENVGKELSSIYIEEKEEQREVEEKHKRSIKVQYHKRENSNGQIEYSKQKIDYSTLNGIKKSLRNYDYTKTKLTDLDKGITTYKLEPITVIHVGNLEFCYHGNNIASIEIHDAEDSPYTTYIEENNELVETISKLSMLLLVYNNDSCPSYRIFNNTLPPKAGVIKQAIGRAFNSRKDNGEDKEEYIFMDLPEIYKRHKVIICKHGNERSIFIKVANIECG